MTNQLKQEEMMQQFTPMLIAWAFMLTPLYSQTPEWRQTNGPLGGDVNALVVTETGTLFAGTRLGGLFFSTDGGENWTHSEESLWAPFLFNGVWDLEKNSQGHLFAATARGVYRSTDNGDSWTAVTSGLTDLFIQAIAINSGDVIFAGSYREGIFRSDDNGESWTAINNGLTVLEVHSVAINSLGDVFAGTWDGIFISTDDGDNWTEVSNGVDNGFVLDIFVTPEDILLAGTGEGAYRSSDDGANWTKVIQFSGIRSFARNTSSVLFAGGSGGFFFRSSDNGLTWETAGDQLTFASFQDLYVTPSEDLLAATHNYGIIHSADNGDSWEQWNAGMTAVDVVSMTQTEGGAMLAGTNEGIFRTTDGGESWIWLFESEIGIDVRFIASNGSGRLFASVDGSLVISDDNGDTWFVADSSFSGHFPSSIAFGGASDVYVGLSGQIFKSADGGDTWTELTTPIPSTAIQAMGVSAAGTVFAGTRSNGVFRSTDTGTTWDEVNDGLGANFDMTAFLFQPNDDVLVSGFDGVFSSSDNGNMWVQMGTVPTLGVKDLVRDSEGNLFVASRGGGIAVSEDDGATWTNISSGLWHKDAKALLIDGAENIYVGTRGGSVFKTQFLPTSVDQTQGQLPTTFVLEQVYPNPVQEKTTIRYDLPVHSDVRLTIHNVRGQEVAKLVDGWQAAGRKSVSWDAEKYPSGVYVYKLNAGDQVLTRRMLIVR